MYKMELIWLNLYNNRLFYIFYLLPTYKNMENYICPRCNYMTNKLSNLKKHLSRKNLCKPLYTDISVEEICEEYNIKYVQLNHFDSFMSHSNKSIDLNVCQFCNKQLSTKSNLTRHIKTCKKNMNSMKIIELEKKIKNIEESICVNITNNGNNYNNSNIYNQTNNIIINNYGSENLSYLTPEKMMKLISPPYSSIKKLNSLIHMNDDHPENHNLVITNLNGQYLHVLKNETWTKCFKKDILSSIVSDSYDKLDDFFIENKDKIPLKIIRRIELFQDKFEENEKLRKKICNDVELLLFNKTSDWL